MLIVALARARLPGETVPREAVVDALPSHPAGPQRSQRVPERGSRDRMSDDGDGTETPVESEACDSSAEAEVDTS